MMPVAIEGIVDTLLEGHTEKAMDDIVQCLTNPEELNLQQEFGVLIKEAARQEEVQRSHMKDILRAYLSMKEGHEKAIIQDKSADAVGEEISRLQSKHEEVLQTSSTINQQCEELQREREKAKVKLQELSKLKETVKEDTTQVLPKTRYIVSLYSCCTRIKWDYDCKPEEIKGYVSTSKDVRPFSLDSRQNSKFFITNYLWDLVEAASEAK